MNNNKLQGNDQGKNVEQKPCFETTNPKIFTNLHNAAVLKAAKILALNGKDKNINNFIINTGMAKDNRTMAHTGFIGTWLGNQFEVGMVLQVTEWQTPTDFDGKDKAKLDEIKRINEKAIQKVRKQILDALNEYFKWFAGTDGTTIKEDDLVEFIPDYNGGEIQLKKNEIVGMDDKAKDEYLSNRAGMIKGKEQDNKGGNFKPRIGYKVGYNITYTNGVAK